MKNANDLFLILIIFIAALFTRAPLLGYVHQVVFDEVHFGKFISSYCCTHERFFDIHPPIGKLIIAAGASASGYTGDFPFESIGQSYGTMPIERIRVALAVIASLLPVSIFVLLRQVGVSPVFAFLGGFAVAFDNALIVESRLIITDSILLAATFGALACAFAAIRSSRRDYSWMWTVCAGVLSGIAAGTKFTGLAAGAVVAVVFFTLDIARIPCEFCALCRVCIRMDASFFSLDHARFWRRLGGAERGVCKGFHHDSQADGFGEL